MRFLLKWSLRITALVMLLLASLVVLVLNPTLLYANKTTINKYTIYHEKPLEKEFITRLIEANKLIKESEIYNSDLKVDICLNNRSIYGSVIEAIKGPAFGYGFYNKVVIMGDINSKENYTEIRGYKWNLTQLISHEVMHCIQYKTLGFINSNPVANHPDWKYEGYCEYVSRQSEEQINLAKNIERLNDAELKDKSAWSIDFSDSTISPKDYYKSMMLVQYCKDIKKMSYLEILEDTTTEENVRQEMMTWYNKK